MSNSTVLKSIYSTTDYGMFTPMKGNRKVCKVNLKNLRGQIHTAEDITPIEVNKDFQIIDGQHRLEIAKEKNLPIPFYMNDNGNLKTVQKKNSNSKKWSIEDYTESYIVQGSNDYKVYKEFRESYGFSHSICMQILNGYDDSARAYDFQNGNLKIKNMDESLKIARTLSEIGQYYDGYKRRSFIAALLRCMKNEKFKVEDFIKKLGFQGGKLQHCANYKQYLRTIEDIYNYRNLKKINLSI